MPPGHNLKPLSHGSGGRSNPGGIVICSLDYFKQELPLHNFNQIHLVKTVVIGDGGEGG